MDFPEADDPLEQIADRVVKKAVRSSPWLALSLLFHGGLFALLPLIIFCERLQETRESTRVTITMDSVRVDPDRNYKPVAGGPPSSDGVGLDEPTIVFPDARPAERNESMDGADHEQISGESLAALSHLGADAVPAGAFRGRFASGPPGTNDVMGVGGGSGRGLRFGGKLGGRQNLVARGGGSSATEYAVEAGLAWLARHQLPDGHWGGGRDTYRCGVCVGGANIEHCDLGVTALAAAAYIGAGYGPGCGDGTARDPSTGKFLHYGATVRAALKWLEQHQDPDGRFQAGWGDGLQIAPMYGQAFGTLAFCEAYRATRSETYRVLAQRSLDWLQNARSYTSGWRYAPGGDQSDLSVTGACVQALRSAKLSGLSVSEKTRAGVESFLAKVTDSSGVAGYIVEHRRIRQLGAAMPAVGIYVSRFVDPNKLSPRYEVAAQTVQKNVLEKTGYALELEFDSDFYCWYYAMLALFDAEGPRGAHFKAVNDHVTRKLCRLQERSGCSAGSWDPRRDIYTNYGGRACATALNVLTLEVYYRYATDESIATTTTTAAPTTAPTTGR